MAIGCMSIDDTQQVSGIVGELLEHHDEALVIGLNQSSCGEKPKISIYSKLLNQDSTLCNYLSCLIEELVNRHDQQGCSQST